MKYKKYLDGCNEYLKLHDDIDAAIRQSIQWAIEDTKLRERRRAARIVKKHRGFLCGCNGRAGCMVSAEDEILGRKSK